MGFSQADYLSMQARLLSGKRRASVNADPNQREVGSGGIQSEVEQYLKSHFPNAWYDLKRSDVRTTSRLGVPDVCGVFYGIPFGLELKSKGGKPSPEQLGELAWMEKSGARTKIAWSVAEAVEFFEQLKQEKKI